MIYEDELTDDEIEQKLKTFTDNRRLLFYKDAEERLLSLGQENWNGDKKNFEARLDYIQREIKSLEKKISLKKIGCPIISCKVTIT